MPPEILDGILERVCHRFAKHLSSQSRSFLALSLKSLFFSFYRQVCSATHFRIWRSSFSFWLRQDFFGDFGSSGGKTSPDTETASMAACAAPLAPLAEEGDGDLAAFLQVQTLPWRWSVDSNLKMCVRCSIHLTICSVLSTNTLKEHFIVRRFATLSFCHVLVRYPYGGDRYINDISLYF